MTPEEALQKIIDACGSKSKITVKRGALKTARTDFSLYSEESVLDFIHAGGLEKAEFIGYGTWENDPNQANKAKIYEYRFYPKNKFGYFAAAYIAATSFWVIKSFKEDTENDHRNLQFKDLQKMIQDQERNK